MHRGELQCIGLGMKVEIFDEPIVNTDLKLDNLENKGTLEGKVITRAGEIQSEIDPTTGQKIKESEILWPTPIFGEPTPVTIFKTKSNIAPQEFLKARDPKKGRADKMKLLKLQNPFEETYSEAGIYRYNDNDIEKIKVETKIKPDELLQASEIFLSNGAKAPSIPPFFQTICNGSLRLHCISHHG